MVAAVGREPKWPVLATGVLVTGVPIGAASPGHPESAIRWHSATRRRKLPWGSCYPKRIGSPKTTKSSGGIPRTSNQSNLASELVRTSRLWGAVGGNQARFANHRRGGGLGAGDAEARSLEIRPGLRRAILANRADVEPVTLGEGLRYAGFDGRGKAGQNGQCSRDECCKSDCGKCVDHDGPLSWAIRPVVSLDGYVPTPSFRVSSPDRKMVSSRPVFV